MEYILTAPIPVFGTSATPPVTPNTVLYRSHPQKGLSLCLLI